MKLVNLSYFKFLLIQKMHCQQGCVDILKTNTLIYEIKRITQASFIWSGPSV